MLEKGQRFAIGTQQWRVAYVNLSRAHCVGTSSRQVTVLDKHTGESRTFTAASQQTMDISPNSAIELLAEVR